MPNVIDIGKLKGDRISSLLRSLDERISLKHVHRRLQVPEHIHGSSAPLCRASAQATLTHRCGPDRRSPRSSS